MATVEECVARIQKLKWKQLQTLWEQILAGDTPSWDPGQAFQYLIIRMYELDKAEVRWHYRVSMPDSDETMEEIDGSVRLGSLYALLESKDEAKNIAIAPIAKLRNQLLRRPAGTIGLVFSSKGFTPAALALARFTLPQPILLWVPDEIQYALEQKKIVSLTETKYRGCVDYGLADYDITK